MSTMSLLRVWPLLMCILCMVGAETNPPLNESQSEAVRTTLHHILKLDVPAPLDNGPAHVHKDLLPKHMLELYEKYNKEATGLAETIRSIEPLQDYKAFANEMLVFNMSSVSKVEKLKTAQFHFHRARLPHRMGMENSNGNNNKPRLSASAPCRVRLYQVLVPPGDQESSTNTRLRSLDTITVSQFTSGGWLTVEISSALKEMFNSPGPSPGFLFGVRFEGPRGKVISPKHFLKDIGKELSSSFIVVFLDDSTGSDATQDVALNPKHAKIMAELFKNALNKTENTKSNATGKGRRKNKKNLQGLEQALKNGEAIRHGKKYYGTKVYADSENASKKKLKPEPKKTENDISELLDFDTVKTYKKIKKALRRHNHKNINSMSVRYDEGAKSIVEEKATRDNETKERKTRSIFDNRLEREMEREDDMGDLTYYDPEIYKNGEYDEDILASTKVPVKRRHKNQARKLRHYYRLVENAQEDQKLSQPSACRKAHLSINFSDINWNWIVSPTKFDAGFCIGSCSLNLTDIKRTNHSVVQSLVHDMMEIPDACCVPGKLKPVNVLFVDPTTRDIVIKRFLDMEVDTCECR